MVVINWSSEYGWLMYSRIILLRNNKKKRRNNNNNAAILRISIIMEEQCSGRASGITIVPFTFRSVLYEPVMALLGRATRSRK